MLSFLEVHVNGTRPAPTSSFTPVPIYRPSGTISPGGGSNGGNSDGGGAGDDPGATVARLFLVATCPAEAKPGQAVTASDRGTVAVADCRSPEAVIGIITRKRSPTLAVVQTAGEVVLGLQDLSPGVDYFLGGDGVIVPPPLDGVEFVQRVGMATSAASLYLSLDGHIIRQR